MCGVQPHGLPAVDVWISTPRSTCSRCLDFNLTVYLQSMFGVQPHGLPAVDVSSCYPKCSLGILLSQIPASHLAFPNVRSASCSPKCPLGTVVKKVAEALKRHDLSNR